jgi:hypothetical protein
MSNHLASFAGLLALSLLSLAAFALDFPPQAGTRNSDYELQLGYPQAT